MPGARYMSSKPKSQSLGTWLTIALAALTLPAVLGVYSAAYVSMGDFETYERGWEDDHVLRCYETELEVAAFVPAGRIEAMARGIPVVLVSHENPRAARDLLP